MAKFKPVSKLKEVSNEGITYFIAKSSQIRILLLNECVSIKITKHGGGFKNFII